MGVAEVYRKTIKKKDLFWNVYVCRPIAAVLVHWWKDTPITPNQITLSALFVALGSAAMIVWAPGYAGLLAGVFVYQFSYVLDCADGMLARWRQIASPQGHLLDFLMDEIKAFIILGAVATRLFRDRGDVLFLLLGIGGLICLASGIALTTFLRRPEIAPPRVADGTEGAASAPPPSPMRRMVGIAESAGKFLIHYPSYILYAALAGHIEFYFYPYIAVNALYAVRAFAGVALRFGRA